jgi:hypothetical protein
MEIIRCLKRFVAREIFGYLCREPKSTAYFGENEQDDRSNLNRASGPI